MNVVYLGDASEHSRALSSDARGDGHFLFAGEDLSERDEELYVRGLRVVWSSGGHVLKSFVLQSPSIQAVWCTFGEGKRSLCMLQGETITVYSPEGGVYAVALPGKFDRIWPLPEGLLAERATGPAETTPDPDLPTLFSLLHPLEELKPLSVFDTSIGTPGAEQKIGEFVCDPCNKVVFTCNHSPFIVTYHERKHTHTFWVLRQSRAEILKRIRCGHLADLSTSFVPNTPEAAGKTRSQPSFASRLSRSPSELGEDDDEDIDTELFIEMVWSQDNRVPRATNFFFSWCSEQQCLLLCMFTTSTSRLDLLSVIEDASGHVSLQPYTTIKASACLPIKSSWEVGAFNVDIVVQLGSTLSLYSGKLKVCDLQLPCCDAPESCAHREAGTGAESGGETLDSEKVTEIKDAVSNRFSAVLANGRVCRFAISTSPDCALVKACIQALTCALPGSIAHTLRVGYIQQLRRASSSSPCEWSVFSKMIQELIMLPDSFLSASPRAQDRTPSLSRKPKPPVITSPSTPRSRLGVAPWGAKPSTQRRSSKPSINIDVPRDSSNKQQPSAWSKLLESEFHKQYVGLPLEGGVLSLNSEPVIDPVPSVWSVDVKVHLPKFLEALHFVYEDLKLNALARCQLRRLARLLFIIASYLGRADFLDFYTRDFADIGDSVDAIPFAKTVPYAGPKPADLHQWLLYCIRGKTQELYYSALFGVGNRSNVPCQLSRKVCHFYEILTGIESSLSRRAMFTPSTSSYFASSTAFPPASPFFSPRKRNENEEYPLFSPSACTKEVRTWDSSCPAERVVLAMVEEAFTLGDLDRIPFGVALPLREALRSCRHTPPVHWPKEAYVLIGRDDLAKTFLFDPLTTFIRPASTGQDDGGGGEEDEDGTGLVESLAALRFDRDRRLNEVHRLLQSNKRIRVTLPRDQHSELEPGGPEMNTQYQHRLFLQVQRVLALPLARGMYTLASVSPSLTEVLPIPVLCLVGRVPPRNHSVTLDAEKVTASLIDWPSFHNGAAAGLRVSAGKMINRTWIVYNRPEKLNYVHAGFLFGLGLNGHLSSLAASDFFWYLHQKHEATSVGVLLGAATAQRGSMDIGISKMLCLHIQALLPPNFTEVDVSSSVQTAAVLGLGFLYQGTAHRLMTEVLLSEMGRKPTSDKASDREGYSLAAGLALGLVTLGRGSDCAGLGDLQLENRLGQYMAGGRDVVGFDSDKNNNNNNMQNKCSCIKEGELGNVSVTAPGATLALGLMFMKTNNEAVAARLATPDTHFLLDYVRPDFILLRVLSRNLILWDSIRPSVEWIKSQIPAIITDNVQDMLADPSTNEQETKWNSANQQNVDIDFEAIRQAQLNIIAGACISLGLRFAGSAYFQAKKTLMSYLHAFRMLRLKKAKASVGGNESQIHKVDRTTLESCLATCALALSLVMAGTGDLDTFRVLRALQGDKQAPYGQHMALNMAIGFVFLGGGNLTLKTNMSSIAALVCALFPRFPMTADDNRYHFQPMRHLYVLATEPRCVQAVDVDTNLPCHLPLNLVVKDYIGEGTHKVNVVLPAPLPFDQLLSLDLDSPCFWPLKLDFSLQQRGQRIYDRLREHRVIYVKRKTGYLLYEQDPKGLRSILSQSFPLSHSHSHGESSKNNKNNNVSSSSPPSSSSSYSDYASSHSFIAEGATLAFAREFCSTCNNSNSNHSANNKNSSSSSNNNSSSSDGNDVTGAFCTNVLYESLVQEKPEILRTYLIMFHMIGRLGVLEQAWEVANLLLVLAYYQSSFAARLSQVAVPLLQGEFVSLIEAALHMFFTSYETDLQHYVTGSGSLVWRKQLGCFLTLLEVPLAPVLRSGLSQLTELVNMLDPSLLAESRTSHSDPGVIGPKREVVRTSYSDPGYFVVANTPITPLLTRFASPLDSPSGSPRLHSSSLAARSSSLSSVPSASSSSSSSSSISPLCCSSSSSSSGNSALSESLSSSPPSSASVSFPPSISTQSAVFSMSSSAQAIPLASASASSIAPLSHLPPGTNPLLLPLISTIFPSVPCYTLERILKCYRP